MLEALLIALTVIATAILASVYDSQIEDLVTKMEEELDD